MSTRLRHHPCVTQVVRSCGELFAEMAPHMHTANALFEFFARVFDIVYLKMYPAQLDPDTAIDIVTRICRCIYPVLTTKQMSVLLHDQNDKLLADGYDTECQVYYIQRWHVVQIIFKRIISMVQL